MLILGLVIVVLIPICLIGGVLLSFLVVPLFCPRLRESSVVGFFLKILDVPILAAFLFILFWAVVLVVERNAAKDYWNYQGAYDWYRMPLEYPYELRMIDSIDNAYLASFSAEAGVASKDISRIRRYYKEGFLVLGQCDDSCRAEPCRPSWFIFACNTGQVETFSKKEEYLQRIEKYGFEKEPELLTVKENWGSFWARKK
ncbi:MAG: hypothetical protein JSU94_15945 [Phycisphaerales bacterium]|nr:MAG: hypothetical protein JSU94_15945 [Phycisphaerales bacterium]